MIFSTGTAYVGFRVSRRRKGQNIRNQYRRCLYRAYSRPVHRRFAH